MVVKLSVLFRNDRSVFPVSNFKFFFSNIKADESFLFLVLSFPLLPSVVLKVIYL